MDWTKESVIVFGGSGFLGKYLIEKLLELKCRNIICYSRGGDDELADRGVDVFRGDLRNCEGVEVAMQGCTFVFHTAAKAGVWGPRKLYYDINVTGTENVLKACEKHGIKSMIYTSSPSVAFTPTEDVENGDEYLEYPRKFLTHYPDTKAIAERKVLACPWYDLSAIILRPHLLWGPRDPHLLPRILKTAKSGRLKIVGNGENLVDLTYIENAVEAHIRAAEFIRSAGKSFRKAYFISDGRPVNLWEWTNNLLHNAKIPMVTESVPYKTAYRVGAFLEAVYKFIPPIIEPPMTRFVAGQLAFSHYFNISAARKDFGYKPVIDPADAFDKTMEWLRSEGLAGE